MHINNMKRRVRLTESDLHRVIKESVNKILKEQYEDKIEDALFYLDDMKDSYDLAGCEISEEDAEQMIDLMKEGMPEDEAADVVLQGIRDVVSQGWEF